MLSIIICTLNEEHFLPKLIESIYAQRFIDFEVIIVDGGSSDSTLKIANAFAEFYNNIRLVSSPKGIAKQRNYGATLANFQQLLFLDADVELPIDFLYNFHKEIKERNILVGGTRIFSLEKAWKYRFMFWLYSYCYLPLVRIFNPVVHGCSIFSTKSIHKSIGGFKENIMFEDYLYGKDASSISRTRLLKTTFVYTSARRYYGSGNKQIVELVIGGIMTFFKAGLPPNLFKAYNKQTGKHAYEK